MSVSCQGDSFRFDGLGCGEFTVYVGFRAQATGMHQAALTRRNSAGWTGDGGERFGCGVAHPQEGNITGNNPKYWPKWHSSVPNWDSETVDAAG
jgi:hypothetical protein